MMKRCKDCKFWESDSKCAPDGWGICKRVYEPGELMTTCGSSEHVITAAEFSCIQFEAKA